MFAMKSAVPHGRSREALRKNLKLAPVNDVLVTGSSAVTVTLEAYQTVLTTDGVTGAGQQFNLPDGEYVGQKKLLTSDVSGSDTIVASAAALAKLETIQDANRLTNVISAMTFSTDGKFALLEWNGSKWVVVHYSCTITSTFIDTLQCGASPVTATLARLQTTLLSSVAGAELQIPDGEFIGQRKVFVADVTGSGTIVAHSTMVAKLSSLGLFGASGLTGYSSNDVVGGITFDADGERLVLEWTGAKWDIQFASSGVVSVS